jgi:hypothetical protein
VHCFQELATGSLFLPDLFISTSSGGLFFDVPVILISEDLIVGLAQATMIFGAMSSSFSRIHCPSDAIYDRPDLVVNRM